MTTSSRAPALRSVKHGPVVVSRIEVYPRLSEETIAFAALVSFDGGAPVTVQNDGKGGAHRWADYRVADAVEAYAAKLPPICDPELGELPWDGDTLVAVLVERASAPRSAP